MIRRVSFVILLCSTIGFAESPIADYQSKLLEDISVVQSNGNYQQFPGGHDEKWWAQDSQGNKYKLRVKNAAPLFVEVGVSMLADRFGLPNVRTYPIMIKRDGKKIPDLKTAERAVRDIRLTEYRLPGSDGEWFQATIQPVGKLEETKPGSLTHQQIKAFTQWALFYYLTGNNDTHGHPGKNNQLGVVNGRVVNFDSTQSFKFYGRENIGTFMSLIQGYSKSHPEAVAEGIKEFLENAKKVSTKDFETIFQNYVRAMHGFAKFKGFSPVDYQGIFENRLKQLPAEIKGYLSQSAPEVLKKIGNLDSIVLSPEKVPPTIPTQSWDYRGTPPPATSLSPRELMWGLFFEDYHVARNGIEKTWAQQKGVADLIPSLRSTSGQKVAPANPPSGYPVQNCDDYFSSLNPSN